jgi:hypothetical protein
VMLLFCSRSSELQTECYLIWKQKVSLVATESFSDSI